MTVTVDDMQGAQDKWSLDKRIPITLIGALFLQTVAMVWWAATLTSNVGTQEKRITAIELKLSGTDQTLLAVTKLQVQFDEFKARFESFSSNPAQVVVVKDNSEAKQPALTQQRRSNPNRR